MMIARPRLALIGFLVSVAASGANATEPVASVKPSFQWPVAEGWRTETIPFPLEFAKAIPFTGIEELRFSPGMFEPGQGGYWSYAFVWWLDGRPTLGAAEIEATMQQYFAGLITDVANEKKRPIDPARFAASIRAVPGVLKKSGHAVHAFVGTVDAYDAFVTGEPIVLNLEVWVWDCPDAGTRVALLLASPNPGTAPIWGSLRQRRDEFVCHGAASSPSTPR